MFNKLEIGPHEIKYPADSSRQSYTSSERWESHPYSNIGNSCKLLLSVRSPAILIRSTPCAVRLLPLPWLLLVLDAACRWRVLPRAPPQPLMAPPVRAAAARRASRPRLAAAGRASRARRRRSPCLPCAPSPLAMPRCLCSRRPLGCWGCGHGRRGCCWVAGHSRRRCLSRAPSERKLKKLPSFF